MCVVNSFGSAVKLRLEIAPTDERFSDEKMQRILDRFESDHPEPVECQVKGTLPDWLHGSLYRNGPGLYHIGEDRFKHMFDGMAVLHRYTIKDGQITYRNRLVQSEAYKKNKEANRIVVSEFGTMAQPDSRLSIFSRYFKYLYDLIAYPTDNTCVSLMEIGTQMFAFTETSGINEIDPESLETKQHVDLRDYVTLNLATAHLLKDSDHTIWNFATTIAHASYYSVIRIPPPTLDGNAAGNLFAALEVVCTIPARWKLQPGYYHHFGMSENYLVLVEQNLTVPVLGLMSAPFRGLSYCEAFDYHHKEKCLFHVVNKKSGKLLNVKFVAEDFFVLHHVNSFEDNDHLVVDLCSYPDASILMALSLDTDDPLLISGDTDAESRIYDQENHPVFWRFVLPLSDEKHTSEPSDRNLVTLDYTTATAVLQTDGSILCSPQIFTDCALEMPIINPIVASKKYRYCYGLKGSCGFFMETRLMKFDILKNKVSVWCDEKYIPGEPIFVAKPHAREEDDGVLLCPLVSKSDELSSALLILDAATFKEIARAEIPKNIAVPLTCHGIFCEFED